MLRFFGKIKQKIYNFFDNEKKYFSKFSIVSVLFLMTFFTASFFVLIFSNDTSEVFSGIQKKEKYIDIDFKSSTGQIIVETSDDISISKDSLSFLDNYLNLEYIIILPGDYHKFFEKNKFEAKNEYIESITIENDDKNLTRLIIKETDIYGYEITQNDNRIYITPKNPKEIYDKIVVIDPGHGGQDPGTNTNLLMEKDITLDIAVKLVSILDRDPSIKAYITRNSDSYVYLEDRAVFANRFADLFVSVHINANDHILSANGTEVYFYPHSNESDFDITSEQCAEILCDSISAVLSSKRRENKQDDYLVIKETEVPAALCEIGFLSNAEEAQKLADENYRKKAAEGIYNGIKKIFEIYVPQR